MNTAIVHPHRDLAWVVQSLSVRESGDLGGSLHRHGVFVVEDHAGMRRALRRLVERLPNFYVTGEAASAEEALESLDGEMPALILVDLNLPGMNGIELIRRLTKKAKVKCIVVSAYAESERVRAALDAGARGFVSKDEPAKLSALLPVVVQEP